MARIGKVNETYRYWFNLRIGTGAPATGVAGGDITVTIREPGDTAESTPTPAESTTTGGLYYFDIPASFTNTNGAGRYGITIDVDSTSPKVRDTGGDPVTFYVNDLDDVATANDVWSEPLPGSFGAGEAGNILGNNLDAAVTTRATQAQILSDATPFAGANVDATISSRATQAQILSDATPFAGANIDQALSTTESNIRGADGDDLKDISDEIAAIPAAPTAAAVSTQVWTEALPGAFGAGAAGNIVGNNLDAAVTTRATQAQILSDATPFAGANVDATISSRATQAQILSDATPFPGANVDATISSRATQAQILSDATPFPGANIDQSLSGTESNIRGSGSLDLTDLGGSGFATGTDSLEAIRDRMDELIVAAETTATGASTATNIQTGLTQADDFFNNMQVMVINSAGVATRNINDYNQTNGEIIVDALPFTPSVSDPVIILARTGSVPVDSASISTAVWSESLPGAFAGGEAGNIVGNRLDAAVTTRATQAQILSDATPFAGANVDATISSRATQAQILSDATPFAGANVDAAITTRATQADILSDATPFAGANIDATISSRSDFDETTDPVELLDTGGAAGTSASELVADVATYLETGGPNPHGTGTWDGSSSDWSTAEREQIRFRLAMDGTQTNPTTNTGTIEDILDDTAAMQPTVATNLDATVSSRATQAQILSDATPFAGANIDATISSRSDFDETTDPVEMLDSGGAAGTSAAELVADTATYLETGGPNPHGTGAWTGSTASAVATAVWGEALPGAFGAGTAGNILGNNLDATISSVNTAIGLLNDIDISDVQTALTNQGYTVGRAGNLDNLDATISSIATAIGLLNDLSIADVQTALTNQGYTTVRAALLDNLDATISSVNTAIAALNDIDIADVQTALTNQGYTTVRAALLDNLDAAISTLATDLTLVLGLVQQNFMLEQTTYNAAGLLTSAKMRLFTNKTDTDNATDGGSGEGEFATYQITTVAEVSPNDALAKTYKVTKEP